MRRNDDRMKERATVMNSNESKDNRRVTRYSTVQYSTVQYSTVQYSAGYAVSNRIDRNVKE